MNIHLQNYFLLENSFHISCVSHSDDPVHGMFIETRHFFSLNGNTHTQKLLKIKMLHFHSQKAEKKKNQSRFTKERRKAETFKNGKSREFSSINFVFSFFLPSLLL